MISDMEEIFSGEVAAKMETGDFRALARGESAMCGGNDDVAQDGNEDNSGNGLPVVKTGSPPTKERYCSMVSFGGVDTGKSNIQREKRRRKNNFTIKLMAGVKKMEKIMN